ncbi:hypothetical protein SpCBS45565_g03877 [Spizellomyces sp. 'palustris']|nr:hypothetical protein SpCBS45565_g03877 [Spizellomyces sp. 'palustris']
MGVSTILETVRCEAYPHKPSPGCGCHFDVMHLHLNKRGMKHYGATHESEILHKSMVNDYNRRQEDVDLISLGLKKSKDTGQTVEFEMHLELMVEFKVHLTADGSWTSNAEPGTRSSIRHIVFTASYVGYQDGTERYLYICRDISEEREYIDSLKASEARTGLILSTTDDGIYEIYSNQILNPLSLRMYEQLGYTKEEFCCLVRTVPEFMNLLHPDDVQLAEETLREVFSGRLEKIRLELRVKCKNGDYRWLLSRGRAVKFDEHGLPSSLIGAMTNIHERKTAELTLVEKNRQLDSALQQAAAAAQSKAEFLANISHEIRTPLNGIIGLGSILWETSLTADQKDLLKSIRDCADGLLLIVNDVLDFSKIDANKMALENRPFDLLGCIDNAIYLLNLRASEKGIGLYSRVRSGTPRFLWGDGNRLRQVLMNIIGNAVKFTNNGEVVVNIDYDHLDSSRALVHFRIQDTGIGIPDDRRHLLFKPFSQIDNSTSRKYGGTGLGLAISQRLVQMMDPNYGKLTVDSREGQGSTFSFSLEMRVCSSEESANVTREEVKVQREAARLAEKFPMSILMAEDNPVNQKLCLRMLQRLGYTADIAGNGQEAVDACKKKKYDLILMDMQMPTMSGVEATRLIRSDPDIHQPTIYALTANARDTDKDLCIRAGMDGHISKPFRAETLIEMMELCGKEVLRRQTLGP